MLNWAHIHLLLTHIPVIGIGVVIAFLVAGRVRKSRELEWVSLQMIVAFAVLSIAVYLTGSPASHQVREMAGVSRETIHQHSNVADFAFWTMEILGALSLAALVKFRTAAAVPSQFTAALLVLALVVLGLMGWTASLGGRIRQKLANAFGVDVSRFFVVPASLETTLEDPFVQEVKPFLQQLNWVQWQGIITRLQAISGRTALNPRAQAGVPETSAKTNQLPGPAWPLQQSTEVVHR
jgi:uncharacterized membrane protein